MSKLEDSASYKRARWLEQAVHDLRPYFAENTNHQVPDDIRVSIGWPRGSRGGRGGKTIGQCWHRTSVTDGHAEIFISPELGRKTDSVRILGTLAHEVAHSALPEKVGHRKPFALLATALGLEGKPTHTTEGPKFKEWANSFVDRNGIFPGGAININAQHKKQGTRLLKCECEECGYTVRTTAKWIDEAGTPFCGVKSHGRMTTDYEGEEDGE